MHVLHVAHALHLWPGAHAGAEAILNAMPVQSQDGESAAGLPYLQKLVHDLVNTMVSLLLWLSTLQTSRRRQCVALTVWHLRPSCQRSAAAPPAGVGHAVAWTAFRCRARCRGHPLPGAWPPSATLRTA